LALPLGTFLFPMQYRIRYTLWHVNASSAEEAKLYVVETMTKHADRLIGVEPMQMSISLGTPYSSRGTAASRSGSSKTAMAAPSRRFCRPTIDSASIHPAWRLVVPAAACRMLSMKYAAASSKPMERKGSTNGESSAESGAPRPTPVKLSVKAAKIPEKTHDFQQPKLGRPTGPK
jgi:hypothetical protein